MVMPQTARRTSASLRSQRLRRGAAAAEFAIVLPLLILLLLGAADFGRFAYTWIAVTNAARVGAGYAATTPYTTASRPAWESAIQQSVRGDLEQVSRFDAARLKTTITPSVDAEGRRRIAVTVEYPFESIINWTMLPASFPLRQTAVFPGIR